MVDDENILEYMWLVARWASRRARDISDSSACKAAGDAVDRSDAAGGATWLMFRPRDLAESKRDCACTTELRFEF